MKLILAIVVALTLTTGSALAQCGGCPGAAGCGASQTVSLKLLAVSGDTFDVGRMVGKHPLVLLVAGTDNASKAAAAVAQKAFAAPGQTAKYVGVINAGMKATKTAARSWKLGYTVLSDPDKQAMAWLSVDTVPSVVFLNAAGKVIRTETKVTEASVAEGVMALAQSQGKLVDPVCGMTVTKAGAAGSVTYQGKTYYFCSKACKDNFTKDPQKYRRSPLTTWGEARGNEMAGVGSDSGPFRAELEPGPSPRLPVGFRAALPRTRTAQPVSNPCIERQHRVVRCRRACGREQ